MNYAHMNRARRMVKDSYLLTQIAMSSKVLIIRLVDSRLSGGHDRACFLDMDIIGSGLGLQGSDCAERTC